MTKKVSKKPKIEPVELLPEPLAEAKQKLRDITRRMVESDPSFAKPTFHEIEAKQFGEDELANSEWLLNNPVRPSPAPNPYPRKPPIKNTADETSAEPVPPEPTPPAPPHIQTPQEIIDIVKSLTAKAKAGNVQALQRLREGLDRHPEAWQVLGDLSVLAEMEFINHIAAESPILAESLSSSLALFKLSLA